MSAVAHTGLAEQRHERREQVVVAVAAVRVHLRVRADVHRERHLADAACADDLGDVPRPLLVGDHARLEAPADVVDLDEHACLGNCEDVRRAAPLAEMADHDALDRHALLAEQRDLLERQLAVVRGMGRDRETDLALGARRRPKRAFLAGADRAAAGPQLAEDPRPDPGAPPPHRGIRGQARPPARSTDFVRISSGWYSPRYQPAPITMCRPVARASRASPSGLRPIAGTVRSTRPDPPAAAYAPELVDEHRLVVDDRVVAAGAGLHVEERVLVHHRRPERRRVDRAQDGLDLHWRSARPVGAAAGGAVAAVPADPRSRAAVPPMMSAICAASRNAGAYFSM